MLTAEANVYTVGVSSTGASQPDPPRFMHSNSSEFQRELRTSVPLSEDDGDRHSGSGPPHLRVAIRMGDIEPSDDGRQRRLHLDRAIRGRISAFWGELTTSKRRSMHVNRHPMQLLTPPENVALGE